MRVMEAAARAKPTQLQVILGAMVNAHGSVVGSEVVMQAALAQDIAANNVSALLSFLRSKGVIATEYPGDGSVVHRILNMPWCTAKLSGHDTKGLEKAPAPPPERTPRVSQLTYKTRAPGVGLADDYDADETAKAEEIAPPPSHAKIAAADVGRDSDGRKIESGPQDLPATFGEANAVVAKAARATPQPPPTPEAATDPASDDAVEADEPRHHFEVDLLEFGIDQSGHLAVIGPRDILHMDPKVWRPLAKVLCALLPVFEKLEKHP